MKSKKGIIAIIIGVLVLLLAGGGVFGIVKLTSGSTSKDTYRVIKVTKTDGTALVSRADIDDLEAYEGMVLQSGDKVSVNGNSTMVLMLDEDKVCYVEENTEFIVVAEGTQENSKTKIDLVKGAITFDVQNKLSNNSTFEVTTPNSTMAIRGTVVRSETHVDENNNQISTHQTMEGSTGVTDDTKTNSSAVSVDAGFQIIIGAGNGKTTAVDIEDLPDSAVSALFEISKNRNLDIISTGDLEGLLKKLRSKSSYTVEFIYDNKVFATQEVKNGEKISVPLLSPDSEGYWYMDENSPVEKELKIYWRK